MYLMNRQTILQLQIISIFKLQKIQINKTQILKQKLIKLEHKLKLNK